MYFFLSGWICYHFNKEFIIAAVSELSFNVIPNKTLFYKRTYRHLWIHVHDIYNGKRFLFVY